MAQQKYGPSCKKKLTAVTRKLLHRRKHTSNSTSRPYHNTSQIRTANITKTENISLNWLKVI